MLACIALSTLSPLPGTESIAFPLWSILPFVALLLMIATGPVFYPKFWHKYDLIIATTMGIVMALYCVWGLDQSEHVVETLMEYIQFIALLTALYFASACIQIEVRSTATSAVNVVFLLMGAVISNLIGTTGASMLLIRPYMELNKDRMRPYHIVFFIFVVSNIGGALTPIGDPPLFLGFLKGVPFFWTLRYNIVPWLSVLLMLLSIFYVIDRRNATYNPANVGWKEWLPQIRIKGARSFGWLALIVLSVFLDPHVITELPSISYKGHHFSFIREIIFLSAAYMAYRTADKGILKANAFSFYPIREVAFIFIGIFGTMIPALAIVGHYASTELGHSLISVHTLYFATGSMSGFLDNAPTYLSMLTAAMAAQGASIHDTQHVIQFAQNQYPHSLAYLRSISLSAVFFGAMTYIGNGPNFMVRSIAQQWGVKMPTFIAYMTRYSLPILLPVLILLWWLFIR